ncbi:MAG TPA: cytochrome c oxidase subunit II [Longimicrobiales bacterium]|nr:cytochrome c oxidase subunit II [Longimicrobiales bacterium]
MSVRRNQLRLRTAIALGALAGVLAACEGEHPQSTFRPVTEYGLILDRLFDHTFWWTMPVLALVWIVLLYVVFRYRDRPEAATPRQIHGNAKLEVAWTIGPAIIVAAIAVPTIRTIFEVQPKPPADALKVEVIGHQWWWEFRYPEFGGITTANELRIPTGRTIDLVMRSGDVIHSFWIPRLGGKRDVNPLPAKPGHPEHGAGRAHPNHIVFRADSTGVFFGQCAEYCGDSHAVMRVRAVVTSPAEFTGWVQSMNATPAPAAGSLEAQGKQIFESRACVACHTVNGTNARGVLGPNLTNVGQRLFIGDQDRLRTTPENIARWITHPQEFKPGAKMPGTRLSGGGLPPTGLTDTEVQAVAAYLYSLGRTTPAVPAAPAGIAPAAPGAAPVQPAPGAAPAPATTTGTTSTSGMK